MAVLDTNVVLDWWVFREPGALALARAMQQGQLRWLANAPVLAELQQVLQRPLPSKWESHRERALTLSRDPPWMTLVEGTVAPSTTLRCTDASDQKFVDLALNFAARWLFTRDRALLRLAPRAARLGLGILRPEQWPEAGCSG